VSETPVDHTDPNPPTDPVDPAQAGEPAVPVGPGHPSGSDDNADLSSVTTGDIVIDAALQDLAAVEGTDLDGQIEAAEALQRTLQGRLADLGE